MAQAIVNPDEVLKFAKKLSRLSKETAGQTSVVHAAFHSLGSTWRDQEYQKFVPEFEAAIRAIKRFTEVAERYHDYLSRKARKAQEYLDQR
jgi:uncharacterized protein YukE